MAISTPQGPLVLPKKGTQADQGSDLVVASRSFARQTGLKLRSLSRIGFGGMSIRTADQRRISLEHYITLCVGAQDIWRTVTCFVLPEEGPGTLGKAQLQLLLGLPWLYAVNARIDVRDCSIEIGDPDVGEKPTRVQGTELVFCKDHNVLLYPQRALRQQQLEGSEAEEESSESPTSSEESGDDTDTEDEAQFSPSEPDFKTVLSMTLNCHDGKMIRRASSLSEPSISLRRRARWVEKCAANWARRWVSISRFRRDGRHCPEERGRHRRTALGRKPEKKSPQVASSLPTPRRPKFR